MNVMSAFEERLQEIDAYLTLLESLERQVQGGTPVIGDLRITSQQQKILYSSVYLQLYNLVEATATWCINAVAEASADNSRWQPIDLLDTLRREWVRTVARTHLPLNPDNRLSESLAFCERLMNCLPIEKWEIDKGGGGNWDAREIEAISQRIGCDLQISRKAEIDVKQKIRDDKGSLELVKYLRNRLAHGSISFEECGDGITVGDLRDIRERTANYLREVIEGFNRYIDDFLFLNPERRPYVGAFI